MPRLTIVYPCVGRFPGDRYVRSWQMQPLAVAALAGHTPPDWEISFFDDRLEHVDLERPADLAAISIEAFTARRGYQLAAAFRGRGVPVVLGGCHVTLNPEEALGHADAVCVGEAEQVWPAILADAAAGRLARRYDAPADGDLARVRLDRRVFAGKRYFNLALVETSRGCRFSCRFCSIAACHRGVHRRRPAGAVAREVRESGARFVFFVDDNVAADPAEACVLFDALAPLGVRWISQASLQAACDAALVRRMARSGCVGLLVGFESLDGGVLAALGKGVNRTADYAQALANLRAAGIAVYGTFMLGCGQEPPGWVERTVGFARRHRLFLAAFNHVIPFPGTPLHAELSAAGRLRPERWWLSEDYRFGQAPFDGPALSGREIEAACLAARRAFYSWPSILARGCDARANLSSPALARAYLAVNWLMRREIDQKRGIPLGVRR